VSENYFYPQLVADVVYFGALLWAVNNQESWKQTAVFLLTGLATMWIQPLIAVHILAAGAPWQHSNYGTSGAKAKLFAGRILQAS
jgi:hypothetical protein